MDQIGIRVSGMRIDQSGCVVSDSPDVQDLIATHTLRAGTPRAPEDYLHCDLNQSLNCYGNCGGNQAVCVNPEKGCL